MASLENTAEETFTIYWNIKNLRYNTLKNKKYLATPIFYLPNFQDTSWRLLMFPKGANKDSSEYLSLLLRREVGDGPEKILIRCDFLTSVSKKSFEYNFSRKDEHGCENFLPHSEKHIIDFNFHVICKLHYRSSNVSKKSIYAEYFYKSFLNDSENIALVTKKLNADMDIATKKIKHDLAMAKKCTVQTNFCIEKKFFEWAIDESLINNDEYKQTFTFTSVRKNYFINLLLCRNKKFMDVFIQLVEVDGIFRDSLLLLCKMSFFNGAESTALFDKKRQFQREENDIWSIKEAFEISVIETKLKTALPGMSKLKFEFMFSGGEDDTEILMESNCKTSWDIIPIYSSIISNQMARFYDDKILCDAELKVKDKTFPVHKFVLSFMSPVFTAMFSTDAKEKNTGVVEIVDCDKDVIEDMIYFLYNGTFKSFEFLSVHKLYSAADKYGIWILKKMCRHFLIENLTWENICQILSLVDSHSDIELENAAIEIFCLYKTNILLLEDWKEFGKKNKKFADYFFNKCMSLI